MIGIYVLKYVEGKVKLSDMIDRSSFVPVLSLKYEFELNDPIDPRGVIIMPTTYLVNDFISLFNIFSQNYMGNLSLRLTVMNLLH